MKKMVYLTSALLASLTLMFSVINGKRFVIAFERSAIVFLSTLALVVLFAHLLSWGLKMTSLKAKDNKSRMLAKDNALENERTGSENTAI